MYEQLLKEAEEEGLKVISWPFHGKTKGLYYDGVIAINKDLSTTAERTCILAEELGHYYTSYGNIIDQKITTNRKQEEIAKRWAVHRLVNLNDFIRAFKSGACNKYEVAEFLGTTEKFLDKVIEVYYRKYGICKVIDDWIIYFSPFGYLRKDF